MAALDRLVLEGMASVASPATFDVGARTHEIAQAGDLVIDTRQMADAVVQSLDRRLT